MLLETIPVAPTGQYGGVVPRYPLPAEGEQLRALRRARPQRGFVHLAQELELPVEVLVGLEAGRLTLPAQGWDALLLAVLAAPLLAVVDAPGGPA